MGGALDVPEHRGHEGRCAQQAGLNPHLQIEVVGVDIGEVRMVEIPVRDIRLGRGGAKSGATDRAALNDLQGGLVERNAAGGGRVCGVEDRQYPVPDRGGKERNCQTAKQVGCYDSVGYLKKAGIL